jgi:hypothetical protein
MVERSKLAGVGIMAAALAGVVGFSDNLVRLKESILKLVPGLEPGEASITVRDVAVYQVIGADVPEGAHGTLNMAGITIEAVVVNAGTAKALGYNGELVLL